MVVENKQLNRELSSKEIYDILLDVNYIGYIPYLFVSDLHKIWSNLVITGSIDNAFVGNLSKYELSLRKLMLYITSNIFLPVTSSRLFIQKIILLLKDDYDFRQIENAKLNNISFEKIDNATNYSFDLKDISDEIKELINIPIGDNNYKLSPDVEKLLYNFNIIDRLPGTFKHDYSFTRQKMSRYSQITKTLKHRLVFPSFKIDYALKSLPIKYSGINKDKSADIILMIDISESTKDDDNYQSLLKSVLLYYINIYNSSMKLKIILYSHYIYDVLNINNKNDLKRIYLSDFEVVPQVRGWQGAFNSIEGEYKNKNIVCIHDGTYEVDFKSKLNNKWFIVSSVYNKNLDKLSKKSDAYYTNLQIK